MWAKLGATDPSPKIRVSQWPESTKLEGVARKTFKGHWGELLDRNFLLYISLRSPIFIFPGKSSCRKIHFSLGMTGLLKVRL